MRSFKSLDEREILALAISLEEEDARIYADFAEGLRPDFPAVADQFVEMRKQEDGHRHRLLTLYRQKFGEHIPLIRRQDIKGFVSRRPLWLVRPLGLNVVRKQAETMELETRRFYEKSAQRRRTRVFGSCSAIWPRKSESIRIWPRRSPALRSPKKKRRPASDCSCCKSSSPASRD